MVVDVILPNLGFGMEEGRRIAWLKSPGDAVRKGEVLAEIESDKTHVEIDQFTAIINPPQVGILAIGAIRERPAVIDGGLHIRTTAILTVPADHRIVDGLIAARFLEAFDHHLQTFTG
jgi:pyruvate/2-oxoglutarate dehydrogenase complex dihydrolipoamide acyltransferase (E2) component